MKRTEDAAINEAGSSKVKKNPQKEGTKEEENPQEEGHTTKKEAEEGSSCSCSKGCEKPQGSIF